MVFVRVIALTVAGVSTLAVAVVAALQWLDSRFHMCNIWEPCSQKDMEQIHRAESVADFFTVTLLIVCAAAMFGLVRCVNDEQGPRQGLWLLVPGLVAAGFEVAQGSFAWALGLVLSGIFLLVINPSPSVMEPLADPPDGVSSPG